jgi:PhnB protein
MQLLNPYLYFNGQCEEAFKFYQKVLGGEIKAMLSPKGSPMEKQTPPEQLDKIMHARLVFGGKVLMGSDAAPEHYQSPHGFSVTATVAGAISMLANFGFFFGGNRENNSTG